MPSHNPEPQVIVRKRSAGPLVAKQADIGAHLLGGHVSGSSEEVVRVKLEGWRLQMDTLPAFSRYSAHTSASLWCILTECLTVEMSRPSIRDISTVETFAASIA